jgi:uncharacterized protein
MSFDGGGTLGALSLQLLNRLTRQSQNLISRTNVFAGNSIGSFTALSLASGKSPKETFKFFKNEILPAFSVSRAGGLMFNQQSPYTHFTHAIETFFPPNLRLKNLKKRIVVPSFQLYSPELNRSNPVLFHNFPDSPYLNEKASDVILRSSAAQVTYQNYVDGFVVTTNPSTASIAFAMNQERISLDEIALLSIGTGESPLQLRRDVDRWGMIRAENIRSKNVEDFPPNGENFFDRRPNELLPLFLQLVSNGSDYYESMVSSLLLRDRFFRLDLKIPNLSKTDPSVIPILIKIANKTDLRSVVEFVEQNWE